MKEKYREGEKLKNTNISRKFIILRPGGNDTCLVNGIIQDAAERRRINDFIMQMYPNVEQVGFTNLDQKDPKLIMAGGEFCGNATRSTAWQILEGQPGEITISVSGVDKRLRAGVTTNGEVYAQMPIYPDMEKVKQVDEKSYIVEMEGITHYVTFGSENIQGLDIEDIKTEGFKLIKEKKLDQYPAAGVMYVSRDKEGWELNPVVYVRDINTLFYETACGSGTTALGMVLAKQKGGSISQVSIIQPSGLPINTSIDFDGKKYNYAQIQGPIERLVAGTIERKNELDYVIEEIRTEKQLRRALSEEGLSSLYPEIFSKAPYFEKFSDKEIADIFEEYINGGLLFLAKTDRKVIGFGAATPLGLQPEIKGILENTDLNMSNSWYMADLGVQDKYRRNGIGKRLVEERLQAIPKNTTAVMRTSINNIASQDLYYSLGFTKIEGAMQKVEQDRVDGTRQKDVRIFLRKRI